MFYSKDTALAKAQEAGMGLQLPPVGQKPISVGKIVLRGQWFLPTVETANTAKNYKTL